MLGQGRLGSCRAAHAPRLPAPTSCFRAFPCCRAPRQWVACRSSTVPQALVDKESELLVALNREALVKALHQLGEEVDVASSKSDLLCQLALRRVREKLAVVRFPLRLTFTGSRRLRRYLTVPVDVDGVGFADFLLEAMTYNAVIIPEFRERLGLSGTDGEAVRAMGSNGPTVRQRVALPQMWLGMTPLPRSSACVTELVVGPRRNEVAGLLGVNVLRRFDVDIDPSGNQLAFHPAGHAALGLVDTSRLVPVPCTYHKAGAICVPVYINGQGPITGLLDLSSSISMMNWEAAALLGMVNTQLTPEEVQEQQLRLQQRQQRRRRSQATQQKQDQQQQQATDTADASVGPTTSNADLSSGNTSSSSRPGSEGPDNSGSSSGSLSSSSSSAAAPSPANTSSSNVGYYGCVIIESDKVVRPGRRQSSAAAGGTAQPPVHDGAETDPSSSSSSATTSDPGSSSSSSSSSPGSSTPAACGAPAESGAGGPAAPPSPQLPPGAPPLQQLQVSEQAAASDPGGSSSSSSTPPVPGTGPPVPGHSLQPSSGHAPNAGIVSASSAASSSSGAGSKDSSTDKGTGPPSGSAGAGRRVRRSRSSTNKAAGGSSSSSGERGQYRIQRVELQQHRLRASDFQLLVGDLRRPDHSLTILPPPRIGVAHLRSLKQLGLAGQPALLIGADIWGRGRVVLCLEGGVLFLEPGLQPRGVGDNWSCW